MAVRINERYEIVAMLGEGGMGTAYKVADVLNARHFLTLKGVGPGQSSELVDMLKNEFLLLSDLQHPNLLSVYDFEWAQLITDERDLPDDALEPFENMAFFTAEFVEGVRMDEIPADLKLDNRLRLLFELSSVVAYLHRQGILHRDLKPSNIVVGRLETPSPRLKLLDLGLASAPDAPGPPVGAPLYLAPEVLRGDVAGIPSEVYALGLVAYEVLSGRRPFLEDSAAAIARSRLAGRFPPLDPALPSPLRTLVHAMLAPHPGDRPSIDDVSHTLWTTMGTPGRRDAVGLPFPGAARLTGRRHELEHIDRMLSRHHTSSDASTEPPSGTLILSGPPGIGKTRLLRMLRTKAQIRGYKVIEAACRSGGAAFTALRSLLGPIVLHRPDLMTPEGDVLRAMLSARPPMAYTRLHAKLSINQPFIHITEAIRSLLRLMARESPVMLVLEDLHLSDPESLDVFTSLSLHLKSPRILLVGTAWPSGSADTPFDKAMRRLSRELPEGCFVELRGLDEKEIALLIARSTTRPVPEPEVIKRLERHSRGNPLFLEELLRMSTGYSSLEALLETSALPSAVSEAFREQLLTLLPSTLTVLKGLAVWGTSATEEDVSHVTRQDRSSCSMGLEEAAAGQLIREDGKGYWFWHGSIVQVVEELMKEDERRIYHLRAGQRREKRGEARDLERLSLLVTHFENAGDASRALGYALSGAHVADEQFLARQALTFYEAALRLLPMVNAFTFEATPGVLQLRMNLIRQYVRTGEYDRAESEVNKLFDMSWLFDEPHFHAELKTILGEIAERRGNPALALEHFKHVSSLQSGGSLARTLVRMAGVELRIGRPERSRRYCSQALALLDGAGSKLLMAEIEMQLGRCDARRRRNADALEHYERAQAVYEAARHLPGQAAAHIAMGRLFHTEQRYAQARDAFIQALHLQEQQGDVAGMAGTLERLAAGTWALHDKAAALIYGRRSLDVWRRLGNLHGEAKVLSTLGIIQHSSGAYGPALECATRALECRRRIPGEGELASSYHTLGLLYYEIGALDEARAAELEALAIYQRMKSPIRLNRARQLLGGIAALAGDFEEAHELLTSALEVFREHDDAEMMSDALCFLSDLALRRGRIDEARSRADDALALCPSFDNDALLIQCWIAKARSLRRSDRADVEAVHHMLKTLESRAVKVAIPDIAWQFLEARGRMCLSVRRPLEAVRHLARAVDVIRACYDKLPAALRSIYVRDPRRVAVRLALREAVERARRECLLAPFSSAGVSAGRAEPIP